MTIPTGWTVFLGGCWGLGDCANRRLPGNTPVGVRYLDAFGNRAVASPDGTLWVEGIGTGVNAGKPDGMWWPWSSLLAAGPTNAEPWVPDDTQGTPEDASGHPIAPTAPAPGPGAPLAPVAPPDVPAESVPAPAPVAPPSEPPTATVTVSAHPSGGVLVRFEHVSGEVFERVLHATEHIVDAIKAELAKHFGHG